jgi:hypothetical protein
MFDPGEEDLCSWESKNIEERIQDQSYLFGREDYRNKATNTITVLGSISGKCFL